MLQETMVVWISRRIKVSLKDVYTKKIYDSAEAHRRELTDEDALFCLDYMKEVWILYAVWWYNNHDCILNSTRTYFAQIHKKKHYMPYLWFAKELRCPNAIAIFMSGTVRSFWVYYISWSDLRLWLSFMKKDWFHTHAIGLKKQAPKKPYVKKYIKMTLFLKYLEDIYKWFQIFNDTWMEPAIPQFKQTIDVGTTMDCANAWEMYELTKDKDKLLEYVAELECKNKYPFYILRQDIDRIEKVKSFK